MVETKQARAPNFQIQTENSPDQKIIKPKPL